MGAEQTVPADITSQETQIAIRPMQAGDAAAVAAMVQALAREKGGRAVPKLTAEDLLKNGDLVDVTVAKSGSGDVAGACLSLMTFSTWRGAKGMYVVDLFVDPKWRGRNLGEALLRAAARRARERGAQFIKLEVDLNNDGAGRFYDRLGFTRNTYDRLFVLERDGLVKFLS
jgi:ribosomal protein S18 acetylase RimI-like enzyme